MRLFRPPDVQELADEGNIQGLIQALGHNQANSVRLEAAKSLGQLGASEAIEPLSEALNDEDRQVRLSAIHALGMIGMPAVHPIMKALRNEDEKVRQRAADTLQLIDVPVEGLLLSVLKEDDPYALVKAKVAMVLESQQGLDE
jgi:HEAT repeat protein